MWWICHCCPHGSIVWFNKGWNNILSCQRSLLRPIGPRRWQHICQRNKQSYNSQSLESVTYVTCAVRKHNRMTVSDAYSVMVITSNCVPLARCGPYKILIWPVLHRATGLRKSYIIAPRIRLSSYIYVTSGYDCVIWGMPCRRFWSVCHETDRYKLTAN